MAHDVILFNAPLSYINNPLAQFGSLHLTKDVPYKTFNPGLLSIGTYLDWKKYNVKIYDIIYEKDIENVVRKALYNEAPYLVGISCSYGLSYIPTIKIANIVKQIIPHTFIVAGGQDIGMLGGIALKECSSLDAVERFEGEIPLLKILEYLKGRLSITKIPGLVFRIKELNKDTPYDKTKIKPFVYMDIQKDYKMVEVTYEDILENIEKPAVVDLNELPHMKFDLYDDYLTYSPFIEESRGCCWKCEYCSSGFTNSSKIRIKDSKKFLDDLRHCINIYGKDLQLPFLASTFGVNVKNTTEILQGIVDEYKELNWVSEFRVDINWESYLDLMYKSGCRAYAIGMESASPQVLQNMCKTPNPKFYLEKTEKLIKHIKTFPNHILHVNFMFYAGETPETLKENIKFICKYIDDIHSVHYSPLLVYPNAALWKKICFYYEKYGTTLVKGDIWDKMHLYPINPSKYFKYEDAGYFSRIIEKITVSSAEFISMHETRFGRSKDGYISEKAKKKFLDDILNSY